MEEEEFKEFDDDTQQGTLQILKTLVQECREFGSIQDAIKIQDEELRSMQGEVDRLRARRDELESKLNEPHCRSVRELILSNLSSTPKKASKKSVGGSAFHDEIAEQIPLQVKRRRLEETRTAYALAGNTFAYLEENHMEIRFETFFAGKYYEHYCIFLEFNYANETLRIFKHTIPFFIPLDDIQRKYLNSNFKAFMDCVSEYCNSYVSRREQVASLAECNSLQVDKVSMSRSADLVIIHAKHNNRQLQVKLTYADLKTTLPQRAEVNKIEVARESATGQLQETKWRLKEVEQYFLETRLKDACQKAFP